MNTNKTATPVLGKIEWAAATVISLCIVILHIVVLKNAGDLWRDEINTATVAQAHTITESWHLLPFESAPFLFHLLLRSWTAIFGGSDGTLRLFGFLVGTGIVAALWLNARMLGRSLPLISLTVFGMNPVVIRFGDAIRAYGLGILFMLLTVALVWRLATSPNRLTVVLAILTALCAVQSLYQNAFFVFAICVAGMAVTVRHRFWKRAGLILTVGGLAAVSLLPYIPIINRAQQYLSLYQADFGFGRALKVLSATLNSSGVFMSGTWGVLLLIGACIAIAAQFPRNFNLPAVKRDLALYCGMAAAIGVVCFCVFWKTSKLDMSPWYSILPLTLLAVFLDAMAAVLPGAKFRICFVLCLTASIVAGSFSAVWARCHMPHTNIGRIAAKLAISAGKDDLIVVIPWYIGTTFQRYYKGPTPWITIPELDDCAIQREDLFKSKMTVTNASASALERISRSLESGHKVWLVGQVFVFSGRPSPQSSSPPSVGEAPSGVSVFWQEKLPTLPPAPFGPRGWDSKPYLEMWGREVAYLFQTHALRGSLEMAETTTVSEQENLPLYVFEGWQ